MKQTILFCSIILVLVVLIKLQGNELRKTKEDLRVETENKYALLSECREYEVSNGMIANECDQLKLTIKEVSKYRDELISQVSILTKKINRIESIQQTQFEVITPVVAPIIIKDSTRTIHWTDNYTTIDAIIDSTFRANITYSDTLIQVVEPHYRVDWWIFRWGLEGVRQKVMLKNKNAHIKFQEYIKIRR